MSGGYPYFRESRSVDRQSMVQERLIGVRIIHREWPKEELTSAILSHKALYRARLHSRQTKISHLLAVTTSRY